MIRRALVALVAAGLLAGAAVARLGLESGGEREVPAGLLYLPKGPYLRALAVGQEDTLADLLYIWAIQYYSNYQDRSRYQYLDAVFRGAITELDPRYTEAYLVGALIMSIEAREPKLALQFLDKGLEEMPDNWEVAYWAGWEAYSGRQYALARTYWARAAAMPDAPPSLARLAARMLELTVNRRAAIAEYERILATTNDEKTRRIVTSWLQRLITTDALDVTREALAQYRELHGRCPPDLDTLVRGGLLPVIPGAASGNPLRYDATTCEVLPAPGESFGGGR